MTYKLDDPSIHLQKQQQHQRVVNAQPSLVQPAQSLQSATQLQVAAQQLQTGQHPQQLQSAPAAQQHNYFGNTHTNRSPYARVVGQGQPQPQQQKTGQSPSTASQILPQAQGQGVTDEGVGVYENRGFAWGNPGTAAAAYYAYGNPGGGAAGGQQGEGAGQQHQAEGQQQDEWNTGGRGRVF
ncbi:hypothetical protein BDU57DRAFT_521207, partial [Ampelomyces quisqualis]